MSQKLVSDYLDSIEVMENNIGLFRDGHQSSYRVVATELRKLLCDGEGTLLPKIFDGFEPHKFHFTKLIEGMPSLAEGLEIMIPGQLEIRNGKPNFKLLFADPPERMDLDSWLDQPFFSPEISLRDVIRSVSDKEGAHADPKYNETLVRAKAIKYCDDESHKHSIIAIGEYVIAYSGHEPMKVRPNIPLKRTPDGAA